MIGYDENMNRYFPRVDPRTVPDMEGVEHAYVCVVTNPEAHCSYQITFLAKQYPAIRHGREEHKGAPCGDDEALRTLAKILPEGVTVTALYVDDTRYEKLKEQDIVRRHNLYNK